MNEETDRLFAVCNLENKEFNGWFVKSKLPKPDKANGESGGNFSICYIVEKDGIEYFMKVLDMRICTLGIIPAGFTRTQYIEKCTREFNYEKALSSYCNDRRIKSVISYQDDGDITMTEFLFGDVSYIVYEKADGDIRKTLNLSKNLVFSEKLKAVATKLRSLHDIAVGIQQLHTHSISHQDMKPSNILSIKDNSKIGDLGRSLCMSPDIRCPYSLNFNGDWGYAPPEAMFNNSRTPKDSSKLYQMDNYMLGSLVVYYICGISFNAIMDFYLPQPLIHMVSSGMTYEEAKTDLQNAYHEALLMFEKDIPINNIKTELIQIVEYLCNPIAEERGHPKNIDTKNLTPNHSLIRTYTELDRLYRKAQIELFKKNNDGTINQ